MTWGNRVTKGAELLNTTSDHVRSAQMTHMAITSLAKADEEGDRFSGLILLGIGVLTFRRGLLLLTRKKTSTEE